MSFINLAIVTRRYAIKRRRQGETTTIVATSLLPLLLLIVIIIPRIFVLYNLSLSLYTHVHHHFTCLFNSKKKKKGNIHFPFLCREK